MIPALRNFDLPAASPGKTAKPAQELPWFHVSLSGKSAKRRLIGKTLSSSSKALCLVNSIADGLAIGQNCPIYAGR